MRAEALLIQLTVTVASGNIAVAVYWSGGPGGHRRVAAKPPESIALLKRDMVRQKGPILAWFIWDGLTFAPQSSAWLATLQQVSISAVQSELADVVASMRHSQLQSQKDSDNCSKS